MNLDSEFHDYTPCFGRQIRTPRREEAFAIIMIKKVHFQAQYIQSNKNPTL